MVEIEQIPVQILYRELPQSPRLSFQRIHDVCARSLQFPVRLIDILSEHPVNRRLERRLSLAKEDRRVAVRHRPNFLAWVKPSNLKAEYISVILLRAFNIGDRQLRHWPAN